MTSDVEPPAVEPRPFGSGKFVTFGVLCLVAYPPAMVLLLLLGLGSSGNCSPGSQCGPSDAPILALLISLVAGAVAFFIAAARRAPAARTTWSRVGYWAVGAAVLFFIVSLAR